MDQADQTRQWGMMEQILQTVVSIALLVLLVGFWAWLWVRPI